MQINNRLIRGVSSLSFSLCVRHFDIKQPAEAAKATALFSVPDFVGDACKAIASRIRGAVASVQFDDFHKVCDTPLEFYCSDTSICLVL